MDDRTAIRDEPALSRRGVPLSAVLAETVVVQGLGTMAVLILSALAPAVANSLGVPTTFIGYQITVIYIAAMTGSLVAGSLVAKHGGCRAGQIAMLLDAVGCLLMSLASIPAIIAGSLVIGAAYGLINPASSELLIRHAPPHRRNLIFSIKQAGVPLGGIVAGIVGPWLALGFGWQSALWAASGACLLAMALAQFGRAELDRPGARPRGTSAAPLAALGLVFRNPPLRWLAFSSLCFSAVQLSVVAFLVALLVEEKELDLVTAGLVLATLQLSGAFGRVFWGAIADALRNGLSVLVGLAVTMIVAALLVAVGTSMPIGLLVGLLVLLGLTANSWNGVYLSEVARLSPPALIGATTGASMFFTFTGVAIGPSLFSQLHDLFGSYQRTYVLIAILSAGAACCLLLVKRMLAARPTGADPARHV